MECRWRVRTGLPKLLTIECRIETLFADVFGECRHLLGVFLGPLWRALDEWGRKQGAPQAREESYVRGKRAPLWFPAEAFACRDDLPCGALLLRGSHCVAL